jgi:hypothetical protein
MLKLPTKGLGTSVTQHNNDLMVLCDWVEASLVILGEPVTKAALADLLIEEHIYADESLCDQRVQDVWAEIRRRQTLLKRSAFITPSSNALKPKSTWTDQPAMTFCLVCSLSPRYSDWTKQFGRKFTDQGELFERICEASLRHQLRGWEVRRTGWSTTNANGLAKVVRELAAFVGDDVGNLKKWAPKKGKEAGVDLAWLLPMADGLAGPRYFAQCASGADWKRKRNEPDLETTWSKYIDFVNVPQRVMLTPFALSADEFVRASPPIKGVLVERFRLLATGRPEQSWVAPDLAASLQAWLTPRIQWLSESELSLLPA